jgi:hypothetical protein
MNFDHAAVASTVLVIRVELPVCKELQSPLDGRIDNFPIEVLYRGGTSAIASQTIGADDGQARISTGTKAFAGFRAVPARNQVYLVLVEFSETNNFTLILLNDEQFHVMFPILNWARQCCTCVPSGGDPEQILTLARLEYAIT